MKIKKKMRVKWNREGGISTACHSFTAVGV